MLKVFQRTKLEVFSELIDATLHCKPNAATLLLCTLFEQLTNTRQASHPLPPSSLFLFEQLFTPL
jgi:hypothetical protein